MIRGSEKLREVFPGQRWSRKKKTPSLSTSTISSIEISSPLQKSFTLDVVDI
jgi:hypothetical protein